jgi:transcriptional regulator with GAF, ATPase, and Fis domain
MSSVEMLGKHCQEVFQCAGCCVLGASRNVEWCWTRCLAGARALQQTSGNQTQAARLLGVTRDTLRYKKKKLNLP